MVSHEENEVLTKLVEELYVGKPKGTLYHYTSLGVAQSIIENGCLWATDIRYMSDSSELANTATLLVNVVANLLHSEGGDAEILGQFGQWVKDRFNNGHSMFVACFSERGNLLSQWRGYCPDGKGVSLGFAPQNLVAAAAAEDFDLVKCVYDREVQVRLAQDVVRAVEQKAKEIGKALPADAANEQCYFPAFERLEVDLLRLAAALKYGAFFEEQEWRLVSKVITRTDLPTINYREGQSMLIPYMEFALPRLPSGKLELARNYLGPTPQPNHSMRSFSNFLSARVVQSELWLSEIPYRKC